MTTALTRGLSPVRSQLASGAVVLVQETSTTPAVAINATFSAGSAYDPPALPGAAYLMSRVLDRGTERHSAESIAEALDERGVALRITTTRHLLTIGCTCLAEDFSDLLALVVDVARRPIFPDQEIAKRRAEMITSLRQDEDNPAKRAVEGLFELLYGPDHPYGRPAKGTLASAERIASEDLRALHERAVRPGSLTLTIVGDVRPDDALERAARELDGWNAMPPEDLLIPQPLRAGRQERTIAMPGKPQTDIAYGFAAIRRLDPRYYAYWMMNNVFGQFGLGGRLAENIRERQGMAYYAFSAFDASVGEGPLLVRAGVDPLNVQRALDAIDEEVRKLGVEGPTPTELEETRQYLIGSIPRMLETNPSIAAFLQNAEQFGLGLDYDQRLPDHLRAVTLDEVRQAAAELLHTDRAAVTIAGPVSAPADD